MELALHRVSNPSPSNVEDGHWGIIGHVLREFDELQPWSSISSGTVVQLGTSVIFSPPRGVSLGKYRYMQLSSTGSQAVLKNRHLVYLKTRSEYPRTLLVNWETVTVQSPTSVEFASLRGVIEGLLFDALNPAIVDVLIHPTVAYPVIAQIFALALQENCVVSYQILAEYKCLHLLGQSELAGVVSRSWSDRSLIARNFVSGLVMNTVVREVKEQYVEYMK
ncbi:hypothetical protein BDP27DRAFT_1412969 [Rhodocollybia butyracea]|uniref:Uncharacterized protein n=1 Tax=Rhodocollybia butyracea TaxID=206335 RepID=A0A9P5QCC9_9AGAR|nr:hypothetical protein BDP27DRAFT_1412969 [Rhodocollybia butyracea]